MGFSLFGRSGDNVTENKTTNVTNDFTTTDSNNQLTKNVLNNVQTTNKSSINNDTRIQNTALQLTDAFNRFATYNLAGSGNVSIGSGTAADDASKYAALFKAFPQPNYNGMNNATPDLSKPLLDFTGLSELSVKNLDALTGLNRSVQTGFAENVTATGKTGLGLAAGGTAAGVLSNPLLWAILAAAGVLVAFLAFRRK